jgi:hypothetical protein
MKEYMGQIPVELRLIQRINVCNKFSGEVLNSDEDVKVTAFVKYCMERYLVSEKKRTSEQLESKVKDTGDV